MKKLLLIIPIIFFASCVTQKACDKKFPPQVNTIDSVVYREVLVPHDTLIQTFYEITDTIVYDSTVFTYENIPYIFTERIHMKGRFSEASAWFSGHKLKGELKEGGFIKLAFWLKYYEKRVETLKQSQKTEVKAAPEPTWWARTWGKVKNIFAWFGLIAAAVSVYAIVGVVKFRFSKII